MIYSILIDNTPIMEVEAGDLKYTEKSIILVSYDKSGTETITGIFPIGYAAVEKDALTLQC